ncbi:probable Golgi to ER traffic protein 4 homolog [Coccomyxa sp. Obi]|nr:probable Golgi to ER traffic protein 4 homolog [Coccomyxa sp. Obi]
MLKTIYHRLRSRKKLVESYDLLQKGARLQLKGDQLTCGSELALLLIHDLEADGAEVSELHRVTDMLEAIQVPYTASSASPEVAEATKIGSAAIRWAKKLGAEEEGAKMHDTIASLICKCQGLEGLHAASEHFSRGEDPGAFAKVLADASKAADSSEKDLLLTRAVLQVLAAGKAENLQERLTFARELMKAYQGLACSSSSTPQAHFTQLLLQAMEVRSLPLVELLQKEYGRSLERDPELGELLEAVKHTYFPSFGGQGMGGILGSLFQRMTTPEMPT